MDKAIFSAGCFWGVDATFRKVKGVKGTLSGYTGGSVEDPDYEQVCTGKTGHVEAVEIIFDPKEVSYEQLLEVFWDIHDPTTMDRQGPSRGTQYRSAIFYFNEEQKEAAIRSKKELERSGRYTDPIVTQILPASRFYCAEEYHQKREGCYIGSDRR